jgi:glycosyltransferase involved in cell wall biosynthesis
MQQVVEVTSTTFSDDILQMVPEMKFDEMNEKGLNYPHHVSVVVNVWGNDDSDLLGRSLESIRRQSHKPYEVIVVIDGPVSRDIEHIIQTFEDNSNFLVRKIKIKNAMGLWHARNEGIQLTRSEFVALHDADDIMHPERLHLQLRELNHTAADLLCTPALEFDVTSKEITGFRVCAVEIIDARTMFWNNPINHSSVMARRKALIEVGGYRNTYLTEDYDLWLRLVIAGKSIRQSKYVLQALGVNDTFLARRGGSEFMSAEKLLHNLLKFTNTFSTTNLWIRLIVRMSYRMGPPIIRKTHKCIARKKLMTNKQLDIADFLTNEPNTIEFRSM